MESEHDVIARFTEQDQQWPLCQCGCIAQHHPHLFADRCSCRSYRPSRPLTANQQRLDDLRFVKMTVKRTHLAFDGRVSQTICAFTDERQLEMFVDHYKDKIEVWNQLSTVNPLVMSIPTFDTAHDAVRYFSIQYER